MFAAFLMITACSANDVEPQPKVSLPTIQQPDSSEIEQVISQFLNREEAISFFLWAAVEGQTVASMSGTTKEKKWQLEGQHARQSYVQLSGRQDKVEWKTKKSSGVLDQTTFGLYSPHEHLKQLQQSFDHVQLVPGNRFESQWTKAQVYLKDEKIKQAVENNLGEQFATTELLKKIAQKIEVRYTLWYNKQSHDLHQMKVEMFKAGDQTPRKMQSLTYLFREPAK